MMDDSNIFLFKVAQKNNNSIIKNTNTNNSNTVKGNAGGTANFTEITPPKITDPLKGKSLLGVGYNFISFLLGLIVIAAVVVIVVAGFRMVAGGGNPAQIAKAKKAIIWAIVGLIVAFMSFAIVQIIQNFLQK